MKIIADAQITKRFEIENPWWQDGKLQFPYEHMKERPYLEQLYKHITDISIRRAIVLMGPRRVGKTVLIYHAVRELIGSGISPKRILYVSVDHPLYNNLSLDDFIERFRSIFNYDLNKEKIFVFFDEIQYMKNWEIYLKTIVDRYPNIKCLVSGSAAAALKLKSCESGAGRFTDFLLPPLTFYEYLLLQKKSEIINVRNVKGKEDEFEIKDIKKLNSYFIEYLNYGGYPELALNDNIRKNPQQFIRNDIIDKVLLRDLPSLYGIEDIQELNSLFTTLAYNTGNEVSLESLSKNSGVSKNTIKRYIQYLEAAFLIKTVNRIDQNGKIFRRANFFKVYLTNPSIRAALFAPVNDGEDDMGSVIETAIFSQWFHAQNISLYYARWNKSKSESGEVDIVCLNKTDLSPLWVVEVKWSDRYHDHPEELKGTIDFCLRNNISELMLTTKKINGVKKYMNTSIKYVMSALYAYQLGYNILKHK